jgi:hypothetical protein
VRWIGRDNGGGALEGQRLTQFQSVIAHIADQTAIGRQLCGQLIGCGDVGTVARGQQKAKQSSLAVCDRMDLCRSAAT